MTQDIHMTRQNYEQEKILFLRSNVWDDDKEEDGDEDEQ